MASMAVVVLIETDDPRIGPENMSTAGDVARMRKAVIENLPRLTRVVAVMPEEMAGMMMEAHEMAMSLAGAESLLHRPPADYVPPTRD
jgi:hypothetical protein